MFREDAIKKLNLKDKINDNDLILLMFIIGESLREFGLSSDDSMSLCNKMGFDKKFQVRAIKWVIDNIITKFPNE